MARAPTTLDDLIRQDLAAEDAYRAEISRLGPYASSRAMGKLITLESAWYATRRALVKAQMENKDGARDCIESGGHEAGQIQGQSFREMYPKPAPEVR